MRSSLMLLSIAAVACFVVGCGTTANTTPHFPAGHAGMAHKLEKGRVLSVREVVIEGTASMTGASLGGAVGTAVGVGAAGPIQDERDLRQTIGSAAVGGAVGAVVGRMVEKQLTQKKAQELSIQLESGERMVVVQVMSDRPFDEDETVQVYTTRTGVSRVFHDDEDPYVDPETKAYIVSDELEETEFEPVTW